MAQIIQFSTHQQCVEKKNHGGDSKKDSPPPANLADKARRSSRCHGASAPNAQIIELRPCSLEEFLRAVEENGGDAHAVCGGKTRFLMTEPDVDELLKNAPPLPPGTHVPSKERVDRLLKKTMKRKSAP